MKRLLPVIAISIFTILLPTTLSAQQGPVLPWNHDSSFTAQPHVTQESSQATTGPRNTGNPLRSTSLRQDGIQPRSPLANADRTAKHPSKDAGIESQARAVVGQEDENPHEPSSHPTNKFPTLEEVDKAFALIEGLENVEPETKAECLEYLNQAKKWLANAYDYRDKAAKHAAEIEQAPELLKQAKTQLETKLPDPTPEFAQDSTLAQLEQLQSQAEEELKVARDLLAQREATVNSKVRTDRKAELIKLKETTKEQLDAVETELTTAGDKADSQPATIAKQLELKCRRCALAEQLKLIDAERARSEALAELFPVQRDLAHREVSRSEKLAALWQEIVNDFRKAESERQAAEARRAASAAHPAVRQLAERNAELAESRTQLTSKMEAVTKNVEAVRNTLAALEEDLAAVTEKVEVYGMTPTVGLLLRDRRAHLPDTSIHAETITTSEADMQHAQATLLGLESERAALGDIDESIEATIVELGSVADQFEPGYLDHLVRQLFQARREYVDSLQLDYHTYHDDLSNLELESRKLVEKTNEYRAYIDEHVLWIPSSHPLTLSGFRDSWKALLTFADISFWKDVVGSTIGNCFGHPWVSVGLILACLLLFAVRSKSVGLLERLGRQVSDEEGMTFLPTIWATCATILLAGLWPLVVWSVGWWMSLSHDSTVLANGLANGFKSIAVVYFAIELMRQICRPDGLAEKHFSWPSTSLAAAHQALTRLTLLTLPILFIVFLFERHDGGVWKESLGRLSALIGLALLVVYLHRVLQPNKSALISSLASQSWIFKLRHVWYVIGVGFPVGLGILLAMGYSYSTEQLVSRLWTVVCLFMGLLFLQELLTRALVVAWNHIKKRRLEELQNEQALNEPANELDERLVDDSVAEVESVGIQLGQLVRGVALLVFVSFNWVIWSDVLPALQILDRVTLWQTTISVTQEVQSPDGAVLTEVVPKDVPVTLAHLIASIFVLMGTYIATKTLPGFLEFAILGRLPMDKGARYAIVIISRYAATLIGLILVCRLLGFSWSSVQWLAAGLTVGLGFGLQEIFANLVSGIIILFERPIRMGDLVTVNGTTGRVTKMQIRATTITDADMKELIVPNKRFITDEVTNWTLSDPVTRFIVPIGISYESDPTEAHDLLMKVAEEHPLVLREPAPSVVFVGFGDSTLDFEVKVYIAQREHFPTALHELNIAIERACRDAKIEIAFPQQELHIRSLPDISPVQLQSPTSESALMKKAG